MYRHFYVLVLLIVCSSQSIAIGQSLADTVITLPTAEVESEGSTLSGARLTVLTPRQVENEYGSTLADLLEHQSGLQIKRYGSSGIATATSRGLSAAHTVVVLDGLNITDPQTGVVDFQTIPLVLLESVDIVHGTGDPNQTTGGLGATVRLTTAQPQKGTTTRVMGSLGAYGERRAGTRIAHGTGRTSILIATEWSEETGDFSYRSPAPQQIQRRRLGAGLKSLTGFAKAAFRGANKGVSLAGWITDMERGLPGPANATPVASMQWDNTARMWSQADYRFGAWTTRLDAAFHHAGIRYENEQTGVSRADEANSFVTRAEASFVTSSLLAQIGIDARSDKTERADQESAEAFASAVLEYGRATVTGGVRVSHWSTDVSTENALVPRIGVTWLVADKDRITLNASLGRAFRAPTITERFWEPGGNPDLVAEKGWSGQIGASVQTGSSGSNRLEISGFYTNLNDRIVWAPALIGAGVQIWRPNNVGTVVTKGLEVILASKFHVSNRIAVEGGVTGGYSDATDRSDRNAASYGHQLRYIPRTTIALHAEMTLDRTTLRIANRTVSERFITSDESMSEPAYNVIDLQLRTWWSAGDYRVALSLVTENLFDQNYEMIRFYPMPPRHLSVRLEFDWN